MRATLALASAALLFGCAATKQVLADPGDLADYRAWRVAAHPGARLARAEVYLSVHPDGAWADEVRASFAAEEARYYDASKASRKAALEYLEYLPHGPHAEAAKALVDSFDETVEKARLAAIVREVKRRGLEQKHERARRAMVRETILDDVALLLDPALYGRSLADAPEPLRRALSGGRFPTIGWVPPRREETLFFAVPSQAGGEDRALTVQLAVLSRGGAVFEGRVRGIDLFVAWAEADLGRTLDPTLAASRHVAAAHVAALLGGALEPRLPEARCRRPPPSARAVLARSCDGWTAVALQGAKAGDVDQIAIVGPSGMQRGP